MSFERQMSSGLFDFPDLVGNRRYSATFVPARGKKDERKMSGVRASELNSASPVRPLELQRKEEHSRSKFYSRLVRLVRVTRKAGWVA